MSMLLMERQCTSTTYSASLNEEAKYEMWAVRLTLCMTSYSCSPFLCSVVACVVHQAQQWFLYVGGDARKE